MHEKLNEKIEAMDEKIAKIIEADINRLELVVTKDNFPNYNELKDVTARMKEIGDALKILADGLESYRAVTSNIKADASP